MRLLKTLLFREKFRDQGTIFSGEQAVIHAPDPFDEIPPVQTPEARYLQVRSSQSPSSLTEEPKTPSAEPLQESLYESVKNITELQNEEKVYSVEIDKSRKVAVLKYRNEKEEISLGELQKRAYGSYGGWKIAPSPIPEPKEEPDTRSRARKIVGGIRKKISAGLRWIWRHLKFW